MKLRKLILIAVLLFAGIGCSEDDEVGFTSLLGSWTYTTPDNKIVVTFDITGGSTELLAIQNQTIVVDGIEGVAVAFTEEILETTIGRLRINANDATLTYPFSIDFNNLSANNDFTEINVETATYTWPWPTINNLENIQIVRK